MNDSPPSSTEPRGPAPDGRILIVDDEPNMRRSTAMILRQAGHSTEEAEDGAVAIQRLESETFAVVLTDLRMPNSGGIEVLRAAIRHAPETQVIVMTGFGTVEAAVEAVREGACDFLYKPFEAHELLLRVAMAQEKGRLVRQVRYYKAEHQRLSASTRIVGQSAAIRALLEKVARVGPTDATVLITGESGTGKELAARELHEASRRSEQPFIAVNCAAITETLLESELFGHAKGSFTGAVRARRGMFEEAHGGTLFIDEIGETSPGFQAKLLRVLQEGEVRRVGESTSIKVDVRVIAATNQDLRRAIAEKRFREDLFYRLNVVPLRMVPLRERKEDIPLLALHFLGGFNQRTGAQKVLGAGAVSRLKVHDWPGNVRELQNIIEQAASLSIAQELSASDIQVEGTPPAPAGIGQPQRLSDVVEQAERRAIEEAMERCQGDQGRVAKELGISSTTLWRRMKRLGLSAELPPPWSSRHLP
ncbi:MAG: sigma-54 dependent transcriptional regulator [Anaeromyxobacteraceae bacterium]